MILSAQSIRERCLYGDKLIEPFSERLNAFGMSYGLSSCGYDIRVAESFIIWPDSKVKLASSMERFSMPDNLCGRVHDKSTWARLGLFVQNTIIEPGWCGYLTLELTNNSDLTREIKAGMPIAQIIFEMLDATTRQPYEGKYQNQAPGVQEPIILKDESND